MDKLIQQVNLYQPVFRRKREPFSAGVMSVIISIAAAFLLMATFFSLYQVQEMKQRADLVEQKNRDMLEKLEELREKLQPREVNRLLVAQKDNLEIDLRDARRLSRMLDFEMQENMPPYSAYFRGLAETSVEGLWLKQLQISQDGEFLSLSGHTLKPELVPRLLQLLKNKPVFDGHSFGEVQMTREQDNGLDRAVMFHLQTISTSEEQANAG